ncbi:tRNA synthetases class I (W and y) domain-containing protein [Phthorimaea operculella]|nr:tRNA synthetases class I (W and y) domain-containing protein [Phthorimaea operculella]
MATLGRRCTSSASASATEKDHSINASLDRPRVGEGEGEGGEWERHVVSGIQPTGALHVGNYFGALRRCVRAQDDGAPLTLFIADLHALTTQHESGVKGAALQEHILELTALSLAAGIDPSRATLFQQSAVPRHAELCWLLACLCTQARLFHLPQYKEKAAKVAKGGGAGEGEQVPLGLLLYPVLQAADVLLYRATHVPVGADQQQHIQLAALLARTFAHRYGRAFPVPRAMLPDDGSDRILSLRDPTRKMSKSDRDKRAAILLTDDDATIADKIRKAVTDCEPRVTWAPDARPGVANLITLHCLAADKLPEEVVEESDGITTAMYKKVVTEALCTALRPVRERAAELRRKPRLLRDVLAVGAARARERADHTYELVSRLAGLTPARSDSEPVIHAVKLPPAPAAAKAKQKARSKVAAR